MYCTSSTNPGYSIGSPPAILNSVTSVPAMQLSTIFSQSFTGSSFSVPNFEKHWRHLKLHVSRIWRLILYFFFNVSFLFFLLFCYVLNMQKKQRSFSLFFLQLPAIRFLILFFLLFHHLLLVLLWFLFQLLLLLLALLRCHHCHRKEQQQTVLSV